MGGRLDRRSDHIVVQPRLSALEAIRADLTTAEAEKLGIRQQISTFTTDMGPSSSNRIHNVQLMADYIDGTIVGPGETFSFNGSVGPRRPSAASARAR